MVAAGPSNERRGELRQQTRVRASESRARVPLPSARRAQAAQRAGREEVAGRVIERLRGERERALAALRLHARRRDAAAHLHEAVEAAPRVPRTGPPVGVEAHVDETGPQRPSRVRRRAPSARARRTGIRARARRRRATAARAARDHGGCRVEARAALAERDLRDDAGLVPVGRIDAQHVGAEAGQEARRDRAREHAREIEHADARQRPVGRAGRRVAAGCGVGALEVHERLGRDRRALRVRPHAAAVRISAAQPPASTTADSSSDAVHRSTTFATVARSSAHPSTRSAAQALVRSVGVQADPAVGGAVVARDRVPQRRQLPADRVDLSRNHREARRRSTRTAPSTPASSAAARPAAPTVAAARSVTLNADGSSASPASSTRAVAAGSPANADQIVESAWRPTAVTRRCYGGAAVWKDRERGDHERIPPTDDLLTTTRAVLPQAPRPRRGR